MSDEYGSHADYMSWVKDDAGSRQQTVENALSKALKGKVDDAFVSDVMDLLSGKLERNVNGEWLTSEASGFNTGLDADNLVSEFIKAKPHFAPKNVGGGATGGNSQQPASNQALFKELETKVTSGSASAKERQEYISIAEQMAQEAREG